ncbi:MAG: hypothetical protein ABW174_01905 [Flavitalea sp.]
MITVETSSKSVGKYVDTKHAETVIREYKHERWVANSEKIGKEDSTSAWWSIEEIEGFLANAKANGADGLKMYFAAYPKDFAEKPEYAGRQTLVMVATEEVATTEGKVNKDLYIKDGENSSVMAYNMGRLTPPWVKGGDEFTGDDWGLGMTIVDRGDKGFCII